jgi:hypothetical protein
MQNFDHNIGFWEKRQFFSQKIGENRWKIVIMTSTPGLGRFLAAAFKGYLHETSIFGRICQFLPSAKNPCRQFLSIFVVLPNFEPKFVFCVNTPLSVARWYIFQPKSQFG